MEHEELTGRIIGAAIEVHRELGPGFLESVYEASLCDELGRRGIPYVRQHPAPLRYKGTWVGEHRLDLLVADRVVVELKAVKDLVDEYFAVVRSYLKACGLKHGLILNFSAMPLTVKRVIRSEGVPAV